jgi:hypothetical protein
MKHTNDQTRSFVFDTHAVAGNDDSSEQSDIRNRNFVAKLMLRWAIKISNTLSISSFAFELEKFTNL